MSLQSVLGGPPINQFNNNALPTLQDVLRFYSQYWGKEGSDSTKEKSVAQALLRFYQDANIPTISELTIKQKIKKSIVELKTILKFVSKSNLKTRKNIEDENHFHSRLQEVFQIRRNTPSNYAPVNNLSTIQAECMLSEPIEIDETDELNGIYKKPILYLFSFSKRIFVSTRRKFLCSLE